MKKTGKEKDIKGPGFKRLKFNLERCADQKNGEK